MNTSKRFAKPNNRRVTGLCPGNRTHTCRAGRLIPAERGAIMEKYKRFPREIVAKSGQGYTVQAYFSPSTGTYSYGVRKGNGNENLYVVAVSDFYGLETRIYVTMDTDKDTMKLVAHAHGDDCITRALMLCVDACEGQLESDDAVFKFYGEWKRGT